MESHLQLRLYDTLTRDKRVFSPIDPARVRMYVCGPTVYDFAHIGNARPVIVFDVLYRLLRHIYGDSHVTYVRNITDVDDKINARAAERGISIQELTKTTYENFKADVAALGCLPPTVEPRATEHIEQMKVLIERLVKSKHAYVEEEHVLFNVSSMPDYGKLSNRSLDEMIAGARVEVAPYKHNPTDFVLWKPSKPGEPAWPSPAGIETPGRPGWHIECSAMADHWLWEKARSGLSEAGLAHPHQFDIHGGGIDLVFPHHENEIAQSRCVFHTGVMANYWMHNGFLQVEGEKMSKSLGNFVTIRELVERMPGDIVRLLMLSTHYRQPLDWTKDRAREIGVELMNWTSVRVTEPGEICTEVIDALCDDLNTPAMLAALRSLAGKGTSSARASLRKTCEFLGFRNFGYPGYFQHAVQGVNVSVDLLKKHYPTVAGLRAALANGASSEEREVLIEKLESDGLRVSIANDGWITLNQKSESDAVIREKIAALIERRAAARAAKDFKESDRIRDELAAMGVVLKDSKDGTTWEIAR